GQGGRFIMNILQNTKQNNITHDDKELVQLAGYHAYKNYKRGHKINVNGKLFRVEHVLKRTEASLDAFTVRNVTILDEDGNISVDKRNGDGELIIVYVGSEQREDWFETNPYLVTKYEPQQLLDADEYYKAVQNNTIDGI